MLLLRCVVSVALHDSHCRLEVEFGTALLTRRDDACAIDHLDEHRLAGVAVEGIDESGETAVIDVIKEELEERKPNAVGVVGLTGGGGEAHAHGNRIRNCRRRNDVRR